MIEKVKEKLNSFCPEILEQAKSLGIDVDAIVKENVDKYGKYSDKTLLTKIRSSIRKKIMDASAIRIRGIIAGSRDRWGKNYPIRLYVVRSTGEHLEVSTWSYEKVYVDQNITEIPAPCIAELSVQKDDYYGTYKLLSISSVKRLTQQEVVEKLLKVAIHPSDIDESMIFKVVVVKGVVQFIYPTTKFEDEQPIGTYPVYVSDARDPPIMYPAIQILFKTTDSTRCRLILERPRYAKPLYYVTDLHELCRDAITLQSHVDQARYVQDGLEGRHVIAVGVVTKVEKSRSSDGTPVNYIDIGVAGLYEYEGEPAQSDLGGATTTGHKAYKESKQESEQSETVKDYRNDVDELSDIKDFEMDLGKDDFSLESALNVDIDSAESILERHNRLVEHVKKLNYTKVLYDTLNQLMSKPIPTSIVTTTVTSKEDDKVKYIAAKFYDSSIASLRLSQNIEVACSFCKSVPCDHVVYLWKYHGKQSYEISKMNIEKIKNLILSYAKACDLPVSAFDPKTIADKLGLNAPISVIAEALELAKKEVSNK